jgi:hypothetical protein
MVILMSRFLGSFCMQGVVKKEFLCNATDLNALSGPGLLMVVIGAEWMVA